MRTTRALRILLVLTAASLLFASACRSAASDTGPSVLPPRPAPPLAPQTEQAPAEEPQAVAEPAGAQPEEVVEQRAVGSVAGQPVFAEEILREWHRAARRELWLVVDKLVATRLARAEASRLGLRLAPEAVEARFVEERRRLEEAIQREARGQSLEEYVREELGASPARYLDGLRSETLRQMIVERAVRSWVLAHENRAVRVLVVPEGGKMSELVGELEAGADFAELARLHSVDDSAPDGGRVPHVVRQEHSPLARLVFQTEVGEVGGPVPAPGHEILVLVEEHRDPVDGLWPAVSELVESSLREDAVTESEFLHWKLAMERRYPIEFERLQELVER
jgi:peptidyl-prolyl cis-trans isomerase C